MGADGGLCGAVGGLRYTSAVTPEPKSLAAAVSACTIWGLLPIFWKQLQHIDAFAVAAHRVLWAAVAVTALLLVTGRGAELVAAFREPQKRRANVLASLFIGGNFVLFIWAVNNGRVTEVSLGYYITPLLNVFLGWLVLRERLGPAQWGAVLLAGLGVLSLVLLQGGMPWVALVLAGCFGTYGLIRKTAPMAAMPGLAAETLLLAPLCVGYLAFFTEDPLQVFLGSGPGQAALLLLTGPATALPLFLFAYGTQRLSLGLVGMLMFISPSLQLLLAVGLYGEPFTTPRAVAFGCIWTAIAVFLWQGRSAARLSGGRR